jgi:hypothetical protein
LTAVATTGSPAVIASTIAQGSPSYLLAIANTSRPGRSAATSFRSPVNDIRPLSPRRAASRSLVLLSSPSPIQMPNTSSRPTMASAARKSSGAFWKASRPTVPTTRIPGGTPSRRRASARSAAPGAGAVTSAPMPIVLTRSGGAIPRVMASAATAAPTARKLSVYLATRRSILMYAPRRSGDWNWWNGKPW